MANWPDPATPPFAQRLPDEPPSAGERLLASHRPGAECPLEAALAQTREAARTQASAPTGPREEKLPAAAEGERAVDRPRAGAEAVGANAQSCGEASASPLRAISSPVSDVAPATSPRPRPLRNSAGAGSLAQRLSRIPRVLLWLLGGAAGALTIAPWRWAWLVCIALALVACLLLGDIAVFWPPGASTAGRCGVIILTVAAGMLIGVELVRGASSANNPVINAATSGCLSISREEPVNATGFAESRRACEPASPPALPATPASPPVLPATPAPRAPPPATRIKVTLPRGGSVVFEIGQGVENTDRTPRARLSRHKQPPRAHRHRVSTTPAAGASEPTTRPVEPTGGLRAEETLVAPGTGGTPAPTPASPAPASTGATAIAPVPQTTSPRATR